MNQPPESVPTPQPHPARPTAAFSLRKIFVNDFELRAGWRLLLFFAILVATPDRAFFFHGGALRGARANSATSQPQRMPSASHHETELPPGRFIDSDGLSSVFLLG